MLRIVRIEPSMSIHPQYPFHPHDKAEKIPPGTVVELEIGLWAMGIEYEAGESLRVQVSGQWPLFRNWAKSPMPEDVEPLNKGLHKLHCSEQYPSRVILPFV